MVNYGAKYSSLPVYQTCEKSGNETIAQPDVPAINPGFHLEKLAGGGGGV